MKAKLSLILIFGLSILTSHAQNSAVFQNDMNFIYQHVNRSHVTTGLLKDYGLLYTNLAKYDGVRRTDNYINSAVWNSIYSSLFFMKFNANTTLVSPTQVASTVASFKTYPDGQRPLINIYGLHFEYEQFKTNAATSNLVYVSNGKIYDTPNRPASPYEKKSTFGIALDVDALDGNHHTFHFRSALFFKNVNFTVSQFEVDFGDGLGYRVAPMNLDIGVTYPNGGEKTLLFKLSYTNGQVLYSQTKVWVRNTTDIGCVNCRYGAPSLEFFPKANITNPPLTETDAGTATIFFGGPDNILDKPLILAEGFDPFNEFFANSLFDLDFIRVPIDLDFPGQTLEDALSNAGYDLIYVNYGNGGAAIRNNAFLLENVIQWVNQRKAANGSTEKNVVMGVSMGGLVARYALRDMELRNINHDTRLYISMPKIL